MRVFLPLISVCLLSLSFWSAKAQTLLPQAEGDKVAMEARIETPRAYFSGICIMIKDGALIRGSLFNEFGISALDFIYDTDKDKVKITAAMAFIDKWYIKRVLRRDLKALLHGLEKGQGTYTNKKRKIVYQFSILDDDAQR